MSFFDQLFTRKLFAFAGNSLLAYDYLLTLSLEVTHIWNEPWSPVNSLFLINRYGNLIGQTFIMLEETGYLSHGSRHFCIAFQVFCTFFLAFSGESIRLFVVIRVCAIVGCSRRVTVFMCTLYVLYVIGVLSASSYLFLSNVGLAEFILLDQVHMCIAPIAPTGWLFCFIPLFLDGCMFVIVCCSLYRFTRDTRGAPPSRLIRLLVRDGLLFYIVALFNVVLTMICWTIYSEDPRNFIQILITYPLLSIVGQRLILNLRRFRARPDSTRDVSEEVDRQMAAMVNVDVELNQLGTEGRRSTLAVRPMGGAEVPSDE